MSVFLKIIKKELSAKIEHEDEFCIVIHDIAPQSPTHLLVIPKKPIVSMASVDPGDQALLGHLLIVCHKIAKKFGLNDRGFRISTNTGQWAGQTVDHLHFHLQGPQKGMGAGSS
jgi:histidine triad (HIT) family protein